MFVCPFRYHQSTQLLRELNLKSLSKIACQAQHSNNYNHINKIRIAQELYPNAYN